MSVPLSDRLDRLVLTVRDIAATRAFYRDVLGMKVVTFDGGRTAWRLGSQKINVHQAGGEFEPKTARPTPGAAGLCFVVARPPAEVTAHLHGRGVEIDEGPVVRLGALGPIESVYVRDPDGNLIELAAYANGRAPRE